MKPKEKAIREVLLQLYLAVRDLEAAHNKTIDALGSTIGSIFTRDAREYSQRCAERLKHARAGLDALGVPAKAFGALDGSLTDESDPKRLGPTH